MSSVVLLGKIFGFLRDIVMADRFGTTLPVASFFLVVGLQATIVIVAADATMIAATTAVCHHRAVAPRYVLNGFLLAVVVAVTQYVTARPLGRLLVGAAQSDWTEVVTALRWTAPGSGALIFLGAIGGVLNATGRLLKAAWLTVLWSVLAFIFLAVFSTPRAAIYLGWSVALVLACLVGVFLIRSDLQNSPARVRAGHWKPFLLIAVAGFLNQASFVIERRAGAAIGEAAIAGIGYAYKLVTVPHGILIGGISLWALPKFIGWERDSDSDASAHLKIIIFMTMSALALVGVLLAVGAPVLVSIALTHGAFGEREAGIVVSAARGYAIGLPAMAGYVVAVRAAQARRLYGLVIMGSMSGVAINEIMIHPLAASLGVFGVTLATSFGNWAVCLILIICLFPSSGRRNRSSHRRTYFSSMPRRRQISGWPAEPAP
ncbi:lipid II flippase MurJ [Frankia sp. Cj3]|uniref:lipid II flippase MurJ n=1 Tax=Frankia sp. Cj3 TaxID=2880976 RepID=UPI001EF3DF07|nr:lipid II flippase MurJ [Frankia sp. Cj3]